MGYYQENYGVSYHGFLYNGTTFTPINYPGATFTYAYGINGSTVVGVYHYGLTYDNSNGNHGFEYDGTNYKTIDFPGVSYTDPLGISGHTVVGTYQDKNWVQHGFEYDGKTFKTIDYPGALNTVIEGISGSTIIGTYQDKSGMEHGFALIPHAVAVPEPSSLALVGMGTLSMLGWAWRYQKQAAA